MIVTKVFCDMKGCHKEISAEGGALLFRALSVSKDFHLCGKHWNEVVKAMTPLFEGEPDEDKNNSAHDRDGSELCAGSDSDKIMAFPHASPEANK